MYCKNKRVLLIFTIFLFITFSLFAESGIISGTVMDKAADIPVSYATVVLVEPDLIELTDESGNFSFQDIAEGLYTVYAYCDGYNKSEIEVNVPLENKLVIFLDKLIFDMELSITAERDHGPAVDSIADDELKHTPSGGDPFEIVNNKGDIVKFESFVLDKPIFQAQEIIENTIDFPLFSMLNITTYRSLPYFTNTYYFDNYIPVFFLTYPDYFMDISLGIVPVSLIKSMDFHPSGKEPSMGPGTGLITSAGIVNELEREKKITFSTSLLDISLFGLLPVSGDSNLYLSLRKSLYEFTLIPIKRLLDANFETDPGYVSTFTIPVEYDYFPGTVDIFARYVRHFSTSNILTLDLFNCTGYFREYDEGIDSDNTYLIHDNLIINQQSALGIKLDSFFMDKHKNSLCIYDSLYTYYKKDIELFWEGRPYSL